MKHLPLAALFATAAVAAQAKTCPDLDRGQQFTTLMYENPVPLVQVRVSVDPVGRS